jgi:hypothetical protein
MAVSYSWKITQLTKKTEQGTDNVVVHCRWELKGTESETGTVGTFPGATPLVYDPANSGSFVPFEDLTEADVISWLESIVVDSYWDHVTERIQEQIDLTDDPAEEVNDEALPWAPISSGSEEVTPEVSGSVE